MRSAPLMLAATAMILSGCGQQNAGGSDGSTSSAPIMRAPGSWKNSITLGEFTVPGAPPEAKKMMQGMLQSAAAIQVCVTPEYAAKVSVADQLAQGPGAKDCTYTTKDISGGKINVVAVCKSGDGKSISLNIAGTASEKKTAALVSVSDTATGGKEMKMAMQIDSEWTGECKPGQPELKAPTAPPVVAN